MANALQFQTARNKLLNGLSVVEVYGEWINKSPDANELIKTVSKQALRFAWEDVRVRNIRMRGIGKGSGRK